MGAYVLALAKLGDFIQASPLFWSLSQRFKPLALICAQKSVAEAAELMGLFAEIILVDPKAATSPSLPFAATAIYGLSLAPKAVTLAETIRAQYPKAAFFGPRLHQGTLTLPPAQALAFAIMKENRLWSPFNLVDVWRRVEPDNLASKTLYWPRPETTLPFEPRPKIGLILGAGHPKRRWPRERHALLAKELLTRFEAKVYLLGGPMEKALGQAVRLELKAGPDLINLTGKTDLNALAQVISGLNLLVGSDTGTLHLGAALGVPVVGLYFGPAWAKETGPYVANGRVIQTLAPCAPCYDDRHCPYRICRAIPEVATVVKAVSQLLTGETSEPRPDLLVPTIDEFGFKVSSLDPNPGPETILADLVREAARAAVDETYRPQKPQGDLNFKEAKFWRRLTARLFSNKPTGQGQERFLGTLADFSLLA
ncbi:MAG: glycosyltransferase family 9 protein [Deltaproteobacteria bacterium]|jgi:ADP-heptose:LPS heptosyltransferase|nr:glycosyltransferase family 9 protein [Deltaproteobacteria bacterium]